jgi:hypothetical protein
VQLIKELHYHTCYFATKKSVLQLLTHWEWSYVAYNHFKRQAM